MIAKSILFGLYLSIVDSIFLTLLKAKSLNLITSNWIIPVSMLVYALQSMVFYSSLFFGISMTVMNLIWDLMSDIMVSISGIYVFDEKLSHIQYIGLFLAFIALLLLR